MKKRDRRDYTEAQKAQVLSVLHANEGNKKKTARETGVPESSLRVWARGRGISADVPAKTEVAKEALADIFERVARAALAALGEDKLAVAPANHLSTVAGTAVDKLLLLRGQPTSITEFIDEGEREERRRRLKQDVALRIVGE